MEDQPGGPPLDMPDPAAQSATRVRLREFSRSLPMALLRAREAVMRHFRPSLRAFDVTEQQWRVLRALSAIPEIEVTELANATFLLAPSLSESCAISKSAASRSVAAAIGICASPSYQSRQRACGSSKKRASIPSRYTPK